MSDLTQCGCGCGCNNAVNTNNFGGNSCIWIILLLVFCGGGCGNGLGSLSGNNGCDDNNSCCSIIWIILLLSICGNGNSIC